MKVNNEDENKRDPFKAGIKQEIYKYTKKIFLKILLARNVRARYREIIGEVAIYHYMGYNHFRGGVLSVINF